MKLSTLIMFFTLPLHTYASMNNSCFIEPYFKNTESYKNILIEKERLFLEGEINDLSLLPNIYLGSSQQSSNTRSFKSIDESGLYAGISQSLYEGNKYNKNKAKIDIEFNNSNLQIFDKKNTYVINLYRAITDYKYKVDLRDLYQSQLDKHRVQFRASKANFESGEIAAVEHEIVSHREKEILNNIINTESEIIQAELDLNAEYNIPVNLLESINYEMIVSCKTKSMNSLLTENRVLDLEREKLNYDIDIASLQPSVSLSLNVSPPESGTWNDLSLSKANFGLSITTSVPLSGLFSVNTYKYKHGLAVKKINQSFDEKQKLLLREKEKVQSKISQLEKNILLLKSKLKLSEKEADYVLTRFKQKKETIISYYRQLDDLEMAKINLKKEEREYDYYKAYLSFLD
ncbi:TolC family protein [Citrobacter sp. S-77]|uniref:TolC family protein n=1 Tax=Citrobacter sp. S-77 TaxID=1080067 RepID=UPI0005F0BCCB|nr:TolC family protein [Citrobacter sp. S-77]